MPRALRYTDFRARRRVLVSSDFGYAPGRAPRPTDIIDKATWKGIVILPDDVAVRTSNYHGATLKHLHDLWGAWIESFGNKHDCMFPVMLDAADDFQAATYNAMTGYYRLSVAALRSALELTAIGAWAQACKKQPDFNLWRAGKCEISFGKTCDGLIGATAVLRQHLYSTINDGLFDHKSAGTGGGFARRIYGGISEFSHARPGHTDGDMRKSNGPIYVRSAFNHVAWIQCEIVGLCFVLLLIARPKQRVPMAAIELFNNVKRLKSRATRAAFQYLYTTPSA